MEIGLTLGLPEIWSLWMGSGPRSVGSTPGSVSGGSVCQKGGHDRVGLFRQMRQPGHQDGHVFLHMNGFHFGLHELQFAQRLPGLGIQDLISFLENHQKVSLGPAVRRTAIRHKTMIVQNSYDLSKQRGLVHGKPPSAQKASATL